MGAEQINQWRCTTQQRRLLAASEKHERYDVPATNLPALVRASFAAVESKNLASVLDGYAEGATFADPHYPRPVMKGKQQISQGLDWAFSSMQEFHFSVRDIVADERNRIAVAIVDCRHILNFMGKELRSEQVFVFRFTRYGKIERLQAYPFYSPHGMGNIALFFQRRRRKWHKQI